MSEETFRDRVYREAREAGYDPETARLIADSCRDAGNDSNARVGALAALYDAKHLTADFIRNQVPFTEAWQMLQDATGDARHIDFKGSFRIRTLLQRRQYA